MYAQARGEPTRRKIEVLELMRAGTDKPGHRRAELRHVACIVAKLSATSRNGAIRVAIEIDLIT